MASAGQFELEQARAQAWLSLTWTNALVYPKTKISGYRADFYHKAQNRLDIFKSLGCSEFWAKNQDYFI